MSGPLILYIPGLKPKPEPGLHRDALRRCLLAGLQKVDANIAAEVSAGDRAFDIVSWTYDFYGEHRDMAIDAPCIDELLQKDAADAAARKSARSWRRRILRTLYHLGDRLPFLIPRLADENVALHLRDLRRYATNENDVAENIRRQLKVPLQAAAKSGRPVLLLAHSMGTVIAWDALWQMSRDPHVDFELDLLITLGSPLGQRYIQQRLLGRDETGDRRYPSNIRHWINIAAVGELTALDRELFVDFEAMLERKLVESIDDYEVENWYRDHGALNVHAEYGYLANRDTAVHIADWWRRQKSASE